VDKNKRQTPQVEKTDVGQVVGTHPQKFAWQAGLHHNLAPQTCITHLMVWKKIIPLLSIIPL
jgi:hypothetical protein